MGGTGSDEESSQRGQGSRRPRQQGRRYRVHFSLTAGELAAVEEAAGRAGLARGAYAAQMILAAAKGADGTAAGPEAPARRRCGNWCAPPAWSAGSE
jgi:hypothetical protein